MIYNRTCVNKQAEYIFNGHYEALSNKDFTLYLIAVSILCSLFLNGYKVE